MRGKSLSALGTVAYKRALERKLTELQGCSVSRADLATGRRPDAFDEMVERQERERAAWQIERNRQLIRDVRAALQRIAADEYGDCQECGKAIPLSRLRAVPWARLCIPCQEQQEGRGEAELDLDAEPEEAVA